MFCLFFALLIFLFNSAILASMHLFSLGGCSLRGAPRIGSIGTRCSADSSLASDSFSFSLILSKSLFILLIFFLLNLALVLSDALIILYFKESIWDFKLSISASSLLNSLFSLESLFRLCLSCLFVKGASNSDWVCSSHGPRGPGTPWGPKFELRLRDSGLVELVEVELRLRSSSLVEAAEVDWAAGV